jgi:hypothetical protein
MLEQFTVEEINLMYIFDTSSRDSLITELSAAVPEFDEPELIEIAENVLNKISEMTDEDFSALELYPEYEDYDEESEV